MAQTMWRRKRQPTPVFMLGEVHGQRSLVGYSPWGRKESDTTERLTHTHTHTQRVQGRAPQVVLEVMEPPMGHFTPASFLCGLGR